MGFIILFSKRMFWVFLLIINNRKGLLKFIIKGFIISDEKVMLIFVVVVVFVFFSVILSIVLWIICGDIRVLFIRDRVGGRLVVCLCIF